MDAPAFVDLHQAFALSPDGESFRAEITPDWAQGRTAFGGLVAGLGLRALARRMSPERSLRSLSVDFVGPVAPGPVTIHANVLREGRALSHGEARIEQNGAVCAVLLGAFGASRDSSLRLSGERPSPAPAPLELPRSPHIEGVMPRFTKHFDFRWLGRDYPFTGAARGHLSGYVRHADPADSDLAGLLCLIDAWPPAVFPAMRAPAPASTVTWMVDVVAPEAVAAHPWDAFWRFEAETVAASHGYGSVEGKLWAPDGTLVAASRQLVVEFSKPG